MKKLIPIVLALCGLGGGVAAGLALRPEAGAHADKAEAQDCAVAHAVGVGEDGHLVPQDSVFVKFSNQFVIPVMGDRAVTSLVMLTLSMEVSAGQDEPIREYEPKIRDAFLRVMFDHANAGGFDSRYFSSAGLDTLRSALKETAIKISGPSVRDVLIVDLVKQNV